MIVLLDSNVLIQVDRGKHYGILIISHDNTFYTFHFTTCIGIRKHKVIKCLLLTIAVFITYKNVTFHSIYTLLQ